jgi:cell division protein FtsB
MRTRFNKQTGWIFVIIVCLYLIVTTTQGIFDLFSAGDKEARRQNEVQSLEKRKEDLVRQNKIATSPGYIEMIARDTLGLSRPGEDTVIISKDLLDIEVKIATPDSSPNWQKWLKLVF